MPTPKQDYQIRRNGVSFNCLTYVRVVQVLHYSYFPKKLCNIEKAMEGGEGGRLGGRLGGREEGGRRKEREGGSEGREGEREGVVQHERKGENG